MGYVYGDIWHVYRNMVYVYGDTWSSMCMEVRDMCNVYGDM